MAAFRICVGLVFCLYAGKVLWPIEGSNYVTTLFSGADLHFKYPGFSWLPDLPASWMNAMVAGMAVAAILFALGLFYRAAAIALFLTWTYYFLAEATVYNNHYYLMVLLTFLMIFMPAHQRFSLDRKRLRLESRQIPFWPVFLLRFQLFVVYFYGGIAKFSAEWLAGNVVMPQGKIIYEFLEQPSFLSPVHFSLFLAWSGLIYDLLIGFLLIWRRTRLMGFAMTAFFHGSNHFLFNIGIFPLMALTTTLIFFEPDWPVRFWNWLRRPRIGRPDWKWLCWGGIAIPLFGLSLGWKDRKSGWGKSRESMLRGWLKASIAIWIVVQLLVPLRHNLIAGNSEWTEEGHQFSWRMMLRTKEVVQLFFMVEDDRLQIRNSRGAEVIDWDLWPEQYQRCIYVPVDARRFRWSDMNGFLPVYEPVVGLRLFCVPRVVNGQEESAERVQETIRGQWQSALGREPLISATLELPEAVDTMREELADDPSWLDDDADPAKTAELLDEIALILADPLDPNSRDNEHRYKTVIDLLAEVVKLNADCGIPPALKRVTPFGFLGSPSGGRSCFVVEDPELKDSGEVVKQLVGEQSPYYMVWLDITRLPPRAWRKLPQWCVILENETPKIICNHHQQMNYAQIRRFAQQPYQLHRYTRHIARRWEEEMGRPAEVYVSSQMRFNYTRTGPVVDPEIDLSKAKYTFMKHNEWILPAPEISSDSE